MKPESNKTKSVIWVLVYTKAKEEAKAYKNIRQQGFETFLPLISSSSKQSNDSLKPLFPRYLFVKIDLTLNNWNLINSSYGVSKIVKFSDVFTSVPHSIIQLIKNKLDSKGVFKQEISTMEFQKGDKVLIKEGAFSGLEAIFIEKKANDRVRLLLNLLNTQVNTEMPNSSVGQKEVIKNFKL